MIAGRLCRNLNIFNKIVKSSKLRCSRQHQFLLKEPIKVPNRAISSTTVHRHGEYERQPPKSDDEIVNISIVDRDGVQTDIKAKVGDNVLWLAHMHGIDIEGACEGELACSTCHVYVSEPHLGTLPDKCDAEEDMLDIANFLQDNSRLGCQIVLGKHLEGMTLRVPAGGDL